MPEAELEDAEKFAEFLEALRRFEEKLNKTPGYLAKGVASTATVSAMQTKGLVADLRKIIERQSQEIANLLQVRQHRHRMDVVVVRVQGAHAHAVAPHLDGPVPTPAHHPRPIHCL